MVSLGENMDIVVADVAKDKERAKALVGYIASLRNRLNSVQGTMKQFADELGVQLGLTGEQVLQGLDETGVIHIDDQARKG
jgi:hypothetical protein